MRSHSFHLALVTIAALAVARCGTEAEAPADTDTDTDVADTDVTDTDTPCEDAEVPYNGIDDDCDPGTPDDDLDGDGDLAAVDCDDQDDTRGPSSDDIGWDGIDQDCDGVDLDATPSRRSLSLDLGLDVDLLYPSVAVNGSHALVVGRTAEPAAGAGLQGVVVDLATGALSPFTLDAPDSTNSVRDIAVWPRAGGFGVMIAFNDWGSGRCNLYGTPVSTDGSPGTRRKLTEEATSQHLCDLGLAVVEQAGADHVFHFQPQGYVSGGEGGNPHVVRRVVDLDDGSTASVLGYGVNQGGGPLILAATPMGDDVVLTYAFAASPAAKVARFDADGLADDPGGVRIYGGLATVLAAPLLPVRVVSDGLASATDGTRTLGVLRTLPGMGEAGPSVEWAQVDLTPGEPYVATVTTGGPETPALLGGPTDLLGTAVVVADVGGGYRAVWAAGGELKSTRPTTDEAVTGDDRLAGERVELLDVGQQGGTVAWLAAVGEDEDAHLHLITAGR